MYITLQRLIKDPRNEGKEIIFADCKYKIIEGVLNRFYETKTLKKYLPVYLPHQPESILEQIEEVLMDEKRTK